jgi:hypothetical protein
MLWAKTILTMCLGIDLFSIATCKASNAAVIVPGMSTRNFLGLALQMP